MAEEKEIDEEKEFVDSVKKWAMENYDAGGHWIIETLHDGEINLFLSLEDAKTYCAALQDRYEDIKNA